MNVSILAKGHNRIIKENENNWIGCVTSSFLYEHPLIIIPSHLLSTTGWVGRVEEELGESREVIDYYIILILRKEGRGIKLRIFNALLA